LQHLLTAGVAVEGAAVDEESEEVINTFDWELASLTDCLLEQIQLC
jgi:lipid-binding SYLF domain-containing protein